MAIFARDCLCQRDTLGSRVGENEPLCNTLLERLEALGSSLRAETRLLQLYAQQAHCS